MTPYRIVCEEAAKAGLLPRDLIGRRRTARYAEARKVAAFRMRMELGMSYPDIGQSLGKRNHSTIMSNLGQRPNRKKFRADKTVLDHIIEAEDKKTKEPKPVPVLLGQESLI